ncbi:MAG: hypothetical protein QOE64_1944 [Frankiales bacterium]|jgi:O-antigen/teichoic acid export membrane protein|nr:hypothetical protein [Frankiales bacterium]
MNVASRALSRDAAMLGGAAIARTGVATITSLLIARALGPAARGDWAVIASLAILVGTVGSLGLPQAAAYGVARFDGTQRRRLVAAALEAGALLGLLAAAVYICLVALGMARGLTAASCAGAAICFGVVVQGVTQYIVLTGAPLIWYAGAELVPAAGMLIAIAIAWALGDVTVLLVVCLSALSTAGGAAVAFVGLHRQRLGVARPHLNLRETASTLRPLIRFGLIGFGAATLSLAVHRLDILLVDGFDGARSAGLYAVAVQFGDAFMVVPVALGYLLFRRGASDTEGHWDDALRTLRWTAAVGALVALVLGLAAPKVITAVVGDSYRESAGALRWLLPGVVFLGLQSLVSNYVAARGRPRAVLFAWLAAAIAGLVLDLLLIPPYGIRGAAAASTISYLLVLGLHVRPLVSVRPSRTL